MKNKDSNSSETKKKRFKLFDMNRDGKGVYEYEDRKPTLKFFFKLFGRKFTKILQINLLMLFQIIPVLIIVFAFFSGNKTPSATELIYAPLYGISLISPSASVTTALDMSSIQMGLPVFTPAFIIVMVCIAALLAVTFGWQNVGAAYVLRGLVRGDAVFVFGDYFYAIKRNLKQGFFLGLLDFLIIVVLALDFSFFFNRGGTFGLDLMYFIIFAMIILYVVMRFYIYLMLVTFDLKTLKIYKNALIFTALGIKRNLMALLGIILLLVITIGLIVLFLPMGISIPIVLPFVYLMGVIGFIQTYAAYPVIDKYMIEPYAYKNSKDTEELSDISSLSSADNSDTTSTDN